MILKDLERPGDIFLDLGPNWFASVMGTGIVAIAAATLPFRVAGLHVFALAIWALAAAWLAVLSAGWMVHWARHTERARDHALLIPYAAAGQARLTLHAPYAAGASVFALLYGMPTWGSPWRGWSLPPPSRCGRHARTRGCRSG